jgi:hypothetical protein
MSPGLSAQVSALLTDPQSSIRVLVIEILGHLYAVFGEVLLLELGSNSRIKPAHIRAIEEVAQHLHLDQGLEVCTPLGRVDLGGTGGSLSSTSMSTSSAQSSPGSSSSLSVHTGSSGGAGSTRKPALGKAKTADVSSGSRAPGGLSSTGRGASLNSKEKFANTTGHMPTSFSRNSSASSGMSGDSVKDGGFNPHWYLSLLSEGKTTQTIYPSSERDLTRIFTGIIDDIRKEDDWQARVSGLGKLSALVTGICYAAGDDGDSSIKHAFIQQIKATPVSDLVQ